MSDASDPARPRGVLAAVTNIERGEWLAVVLSFLLVFVLMTSYSMLKPVRDALGGDWGNVGLAMTWTVNFGLSLVAVSLYGSALTHIRFRAMVPIVYAFFSASFVALYVLRTLLTGSTVVDMGFYIWISLFSLFNLSVFWSLMTDIFNPDQARRLFGVITAGTTVGAILGPIITAVFIGRLGPNGLLLLAAALLLLPIVAVPWLFRLKESRLGNQDLDGARTMMTGLGKDWYDGFTTLLKDPYLLGIAGFILLYVTINTFVYFELQNLTGEYDLEFRAIVWSRMEIATNTLTLLTSVFVTGRIVQLLGMKTALTLMPALVAVGVLALVAAPGLLLLGIFQVGRRVGNYAVTRPAREMLYTVLSREARFKTKPVIDVVVYRGGDVLTSWLFTALVAVTGMGLRGIAVVIGGIAIAWGLLAVRLGRRYAALAGTRPAED